MPDISSAAFLVFIVAIVAPFVCINSGSRELGERRIAAGGVAATVLFFIGLASDDRLMQFFAHMGVWWMAVVALIEVSALRRKR